MKNFILIEPTNVKIIYARKLLLTHCAQLSSLQLKGPTSLLKYSVKNLIWNHPQQSQRLGFSVFTSPLAKNISLRGWITCLSFKWLL